MGPEGADALYFVSAFAFVARAARFRRSLGGSVGRPRPARLLVVFCLRSRVPLLAAARLRRSLLVPLVRALASARRSRPSRSVVRPRALRACPTSSYSFARALASPYQ